MLQACDVNWTKILVDASCFLKAFILLCNRAVTVLMIDANK
jgi:hypothetical protein